MCPVLLPLFTAVSGSIRQIPGSGPPPRSVSAVDYTAARVDRPGGRTRIATTVVVELHAHLVSIDLELLVTADVVAMDAIEVVAGESPEAPVAITQPGDAGPSTLNLRLGSTQAYGMLDPSPKIVELNPQNAIAMRGDVPVAELPGFFEKAFSAAAAAAETAGAEITGPPFGFYPEMPTDTVVVEAGFPVSAPFETAGNVHALVLPGGQAVEAIHIGPYETMEKTYADLQAWMSEQGLRPASGLWECYLSDPRSEPDPTTWRTRIVWPLR